MKILTKYETSTTIHSNSSDFDQEEDKANGIDRHRLDPDEARTHFLSSDERDLNPPSKINSKRRAYRSSSRKRRKNGAELNGLINGLEVTSDEEEESLERKLARLRREVAEVQEDFEKAGKLKEGAAGESKDKQDSLDTLSKVLDSVGSSSAVRHDGAAGRLAQRLVSESKPSLPLEDGAAKEPPESNGADSTISYPSRHQDYNLSKVSEFDSRLALIEAALGIDAISLPTQDRSAAKAVIPSLDTLNKQFIILTTSTDSSLDAVSRRIRQLTQNAEKLEQTRKAAKAAQEALQQEALSPSSVDTRLSDAKDVPKYPEIEDAETTAKINALYGTLSTIESLAPMLPSVLDRLRSLRSIHANAAMASQTLARVESRQEDMKQELQGWREGLEKVEGAMVEGEKTMKGNTEMVEGWVKELEERMRNLGQ